MNPNTPQQNMLPVTPEAFREWDQAMTRAFKGIRGRSRRRRDLQRAAVGRIREAQRAASQR